MMTRIHYVLTACFALVAFIVDIAYPANSREGDAEQATAHFPQPVETQIRLARKFATADKLDDASVLIARLRAQHPRRIDVLEAFADIAAARRDYFDALTAYQAILAQAPTHRGALRGKIDTLARLGAPQLAVEFADRNVGILTSNERDAIAANRTAQQIRWGASAADTGRGSGRFAGIDRALADSEATEVRALDPSVELTATERQLALDRVSALHDRYRMCDAVALYEAMAARPTAVPAYTKAAAASAYLYLEQPEKARDLYREALAENPDDLQSQIGLFYALAESEEHDAALTQIEGTIAVTPKWIGAWSQATIHENPTYARVLSTRASAPLSSNRPGEAWRRLGELSELVPFHMDIRTDYASSMRARGWPRTAEQELRWILAADPDNSGALGERAGALLEMRDYHVAESVLASAQEVAAEDGRVARSARLWQVHNMRELIVDGSFGKSNGGPAGTRDLAIESWLYSSPLAYKYRVFGHAYHAQAKFADETARRDRVGVGLEYRSPLVIATGELSQDIHESETAVAASLAYTPNDFWTFRASADSSANETPLQARLVDIDARRVSVEALWRAHESRSAGLALSYLDFSDGNRREVSQVHWTERVVAGPVYMLDITAALYASNNSLTGASYFNPTSDFSPTLEFANEWIQWRRYTRAFRHRLVLTVGNYWQEGFGTGKANSLRYEQEWAADDRLVFRYGVGRSVHPYDGVETERDYGFFSLNWRF